MAHALGEAFRSIAQSVSQMQDAMWAMNRKMERTSDAVCCMAQRLKVQGCTVQRLDRRMNLLESSSAPAVGKARPSSGRNMCPHAAASAMPLLPSAPCPLGAAASCPLAPPQYVACPALSGSPSPYSSGITPTPSCPAFPAGPDSVVDGGVNRSMSCTGMSCNAGEGNQETCAGGGGGGGVGCGGGGVGGGGCAGAGVCLGGPTVCNTHKCPNYGRMLLKAVQKGQVKQTRVLLSLGADVNYSADGKWTPLHCACARANSVLVTVLLNRGGNVNSKTAYGFAPLHIAADNDYSARCVLLLIAAGADLGSRNRCGRTPLHYAAECGNEAAVRALVSAGASKVAEDDKGRTPQDVAKTLGIRRLLRPCTRGTKACSFVHDVSQFEFNT